MTAAPIRLKEWLHAEAARRGITERCLRMQIARGKVELPPHRRINCRVIEILPETTNAATVGGLA